MSLEGKTAIVTGGASGIGRSVALRLARGGAGVAVLDVDLEGAETAASAARALGREALALQVDVASAAEVHEGAARVHREMGAVHILVNSAGVAGYATFAEMTEEQWDRMIAIHLKGTFNCAKAVVGDMLEGCWGRIVNISSVAALTGASGLAHYTAAKAGIIGLTKALARELGPYGITANAVAPGMIDTPMLRKSGVPDEMLRRSAQMTPVKRIGVPDDIAAACAYLASEEAGFCTGQVLSPNGGVYL